MAPLGAFLVSALLVPGALSQGLADNPKSLNLGASNEQLVLASVCRSGRAGRRGCTRFR
jgi:hypothetical protein